MVFYCMKCPSAQHLEGHQEFTEKISRFRPTYHLWLVADAKFCHYRGQTTLAQHPRE